MAEAHPLVSALNDLASSGAAHDRPAVGSLWHEAACGVLEHLSATRSSPECPPHVVARAGGLLASLVNQAPLAERVLGRLAPATRGSNRHGLIRYEGGACRLDVQIQQDADAGGHGCALLAYEGLPRQVLAVAEGPTGFRLCRLDDYGMGVLELPAPPASCTLRIMSGSDVLLETPRLGDTVA